MDWKLFSYVPGVFLVILIIILIWGAVGSFKRGMKFIGFISLAIAAAVVFGLYAAYGKQIFG